MNSIYAMFLTAARKSYTRFIPEQSIFDRNWNLARVKDYANDLIFDMLTDEAPCMIARLGANELTCIVNYIGVQRGAYPGGVMDFIKGAAPPWWWSERVLGQMQVGAGFFPPTAPNAERFCELMIRDMEEVDLLGSWWKLERLVAPYLTRARRVVLEDLEPFFSERPWTRALEGKNVLVVHPFSKTIESQFEKRDLLFKADFLPTFNLKTVKAVQSIAGEKTQFADWFDALASMQDEIDRVDYDVCIIGCGAYGFPLAAHVKRRGKKAVHLGGVTQLLFGIRGRRWNDHAISMYPYANLYNEHWAGPAADERPTGAAAVEDACYW